MVLHPVTIEREIRFKLVIIISSKVKKILPTSSKFIGTPNVIKCSRRILDLLQSSGFSGGNEERSTSKDRL